MSTQLSIGRLRATRQGKKTIKLQINEQTKANMQTDTETEKTIAVTRGKRWRRVKWVKGNTCKVEDGN